MSGPRLLGAALLALAAGLAANSLAGPLWLDVIDYRYGRSMTSQGIGLDAAVLVLVVPMSVVPSTSSGPSTTGCRATTSGSSCSTSGWSSPPSDCSWRAGWRRARGDWGRAPPAATAEGRG